MSSSSEEDEEMAALFKAESRGEPAAAVLKRLAATSAASAQAADGQQQPSSEAGERSVGSDGGGRVGGGSGSRSGSGGGSGAAASELDLDQLVALTEPTAPQLRPDGDGGGDGDDDDDGDDCGSDTATEGSATDDDMDAPPAQKRAAPSARTASDVVPPAAKRARAPAADADAVEVDDAAAPSAQGPQQWACPLCTLVNGAARQRCDACGEARAMLVAAAPAVPVARASPSGAAARAVASSSAPRFAHVEMPHQKRHRYRADDNARIAAALVAFAAGKLPGDAVRLPDRDLPSGGKLRLEIRFGARARGNEMAQINLDTDNAREVVRLSDWAGPERAMPPPAAAAVAAAAAAASAGSGRRQRPSYRPAHDTAAQQPAQAAASPRDTVQQRPVVFPKIDEGAAIGRAEILMYNGTVRNKNNNTNVKHCAWHGDTGAPVQPGDKDALPVAILFKNVDGQHGAALAEWIGALDNGDVRTILRGRELMQAEPCKNPPWCPDNGVDAWGNPFKMSGFASGTQLGGNDQYDTLLPSSAIRNPKDKGVQPDPKFRSYRYDMSYCEKVFADASKELPALMRRLVEKKVGHFFAPFIYKMHYFTKTGSGQS